MSEIGRIEKYYASHIKTSLDSVAINVMRPKKRKSKEVSFTDVADKHHVEGVPVRVYSAAKTVADCFKFRNKIGLDVAIEALKDCVRQKRVSINEIYRYAKVCRVRNVIRPYMDALC